MRPAILAALGLLFLPGSAQAQKAVPADPSGVYLSEGGEIRMRVARCGGGYCGVIIAAKSRAGNPNASLRGRSLVGVQMLSNFRPAGKMFTGRLYDYRDGKVYPGRMILMSKAIRLSGCILDGLICRSETWTKVN